MARVLGCLLQAHLSNTVDLVPGYHNKASSTIKLVIIFAGGGSCLELEKKYIHHL